MMKKLKLKILDRFIPVSRRKLVFIIDKLMDIIDEVIDDNKYHSTMEMGLMNEIENLKRKYKSCDCNCDKSEDKNNNTGVEIA